MELALRVAVMSFLKIFILMNISKWVRDQLMMLVYWTFYPYLGLPIPGNFPLPHVPALFIALSIWVQLASKLCIEFSDWLSSGCEMSLNAQWHTERKVCENHQPSYSIFRMHHSTYITSQVNLTEETVLSTFTLTSHTNEIVSGRRVKWDLFMYKAQFCA